MNGLPDVSATINGPVSANVSITEDPSFPGNYLAQINATVAGRYILRVDVAGGQAFAINPSTVTILPGKSAWRLRKNLTFFEDRSATKDHNFIICTGLMRTDQDTFRSE